MEMSFRAETDSLAPLAESVPGPLVTVRPTTVRNSMSSWASGARPNRILKAFSVKLAPRLASFPPVSFFQKGLRPRSRTEQETNCATQAR